MLLANSLKPISDPFAKPHGVTSRVWKCPLKMNLTGLRCCASVSITFLWPFTMFAAGPMKPVPPKGVTIGRHIPTAYIRGENEPTQRNLMLIAKALGVKPEELIALAPGEGGSVPQFAQATSTLDGKTRIVVDAEVDAETGLQILQLVRKAQQQSSTKRSAS
jgi:hypothetical protein